MALVGYARVSTDEQTTDPQLGSTDQPADYWKQL
jgi:DNA invertase Pin-like site-specific DNA recombinase